MAVDQVFRFATAIDAPADVNLVGVEIELPIPVFQNDGRLGRVGWTSSVRAAGAFEDDVRHVFAAQTLRALFAQHPFDGVDDVRFSGPVGANDDGDSRWKFESSFFSEALEATELKCL